MLKYQNLRFFDGISGELDFYYDEESQYWSGHIYMPKVSTGLYETCNLFIFEEVITDSGDIQYIKPISENENSTTLKFEFIEELGTSKSIFLYDTTVDNAGIYSIDVKNAIDLDMQSHLVNQGILLHEESNSSVNNITRQIEYKSVDSVYDKEALHCNIAINSDVELIHTRTLNIYEVENGVAVDTIAAITFYGETVAEDERLAVLLSNMGLSVNEEDTIIFRDSDVNELSADWQLINNKRKELLLEAHNIAPFIGTYKAILNAIKFYGYDNLTLKEYWLNINEQSSNFGKLKAVAIPNQTAKGFLAEKSANVELPNSNHKKTSRFSLSYRINETTGVLDEWDIPQTQEITQFSPDEILIKLYGLKKKLQREYLPLHAKIVDITGEADYFAQFKQSVWNNQHTIQVQNSGVEVDFTVWPQRPLFIEDLRFVDIDFNQSTIDSSPILAKNEITDFYDTYYNNELTTFPILDKTPIGCPVILKCNSFPQSWDSADFTWNDAGLASNDYTGADSSLVTMDNWWYKGVYEAEWTVIGPNDFVKTASGTIGEMYEFPFILPYAGKYDVILTLHDLYNARSASVKHDVIEVKCKNVDIYGVYEKKEEVQSWNDYNIPFNRAGGTYDFPQENTTEIRDAIATWYLTLDRANYTVDESAGHEFSITRRYVDANSSTGYSETPGPYVWKYLKEATWNDANNLSWDMTRVSADQNSSFLLDVRQDQGYTNKALTIKWFNQASGIEESESYLIQSTYPVDLHDVSAWQNIASELNGLDKNQYPLLSKFIFNAVFKDSNSDGINDSCEFILAAGREYSSSYDFTDVYFVDNGGLVHGKVNYKGYNPTYNDVRFITGHQDISILTHVVFSFDQTKMPGIAKQTWKLTNNSKNDGDIYYNNQWLTYLFSSRGDYSLELELTDCNGNTNNIKRNILTIK